MPYPVLIISSTIQRSPSTLVIRIIMLAIMLATVLPVIDAQTPTELPHGNIGQVYSDYHFALQPEDSTHRLALPLYWRVSEGELPPGLTLSLSGTLGGVPTAPARSSYTFKVRVEDSSQPKISLESEFTIVIDRGSQRDFFKIVGSTAGQTMTGVKPVVVNFSPVNENDASVTGIADPTVKKVTLEIAELQNPCDPKDSKEQTSKKDKRHKDGKNKAQPQVPCQTGPLNRINVIEQPILNNNTGAFAIKLDNALTKNQEVKITEYNVESAEVSNSGWIAVTPAKDEPLPTGEIKRLIVGYEQSGASSADSVQKPFLDLYIDRPILFNSGKVRLWGDMRFTSVPQSTATLTDIASSFLAPTTSGKANQVVQSLVFTAGIEWRLRTIHVGKQWVSFGLIAGGGFTTPLSVHDSLTEFKINDTIRDFYKLPSAKDDTTHTVIALVNADRDRFLRQYFGGVRLTSTASGKNIPPALFDLTLGQNEAVTTRLQGLVLRLEGFYPLPYEKAKFVYLFGSGLLKLHRANISDHPIIFEPPDTVVPLNSSSLLIRTFPQFNRDSYKIGIGIDLLELIKAKSAAPK